MLLPAQIAYAEAARLAPKSALPLSNLSAVSFEMGNYTDAILFIQSALSLLDTEPHPGIEQKLYLRLAKAYLQSKKLNEARSAISNIKSEQDRRPLEQNLQAMVVLNALVLDDKALWGQVIERLARYRPAL
jgi:tetratricopeptide (TPR) repeat protein